MQRAPSGPVCGPQSLNKLNNRKNQHIKFRPRLNLLTGLTNQQVCIYIFPSCKLLIFLLQIVKNFHNSVLIRICINLENISLDVNTSPNCSTVTSPGQRRPTR
jgi:hypothetical protein